MVGHYVEIRYAGQSSQGLLPALKDSMVGRLVYSAFASAFQIAIGEYNVNAARNNNFCITTILKGHRYNIHRYLFWKLA